MLTCFYYKLQYGVPKVMQEKADRRKVFLDYMNDSNERYASMSLGGKLVVGNEEIEKGTVGNDLY